MNKFMKKRALPYLQDHQASLHLLRGVNRTEKFLKKFLQQYNLYLQGLGVAKNADNVTRSNINGVSKSLIIKF